MNIQGWFPLGLTGLISLLSKGHRRVFSSTAAQKHHFLGCQSPLWSNSHIYPLLLEKPELWLYVPLLAKWCLCFIICGFSGDPAVKNLPVMQETWVGTLDQEDPPEKGMATHSSILAWRIPWWEKPCRLQSMGSQRVGHDWVTNTFTSLSFCYKHNYNPVQYMLSKKKLRG